MPTVLQWVHHLLAQIDRQAAYAAPFETRYRNEYVIPFLQKEYAEVYGTDHVLGLTGPRPPRTGTAAIVVDALVERVSVIGATSEDAEAAKTVETAWRESDLDVMHREATREALIGSRAFAQVSRSTDGRAVVGIDSCTQVAVHREPGPPYDVDAALKVSADEWTGKRTARLWLPGRNLDLVEGDAALLDPEGSGVQSRWQVVSDVPSGLTGVPVVEFCPRPRLLADPVSEIDLIQTEVDIVDLVEGLMVFAGHFGAVPIRWGTGLTPARDPKDPTKLLLGPDGKPILGFNARADHFWGSTEAEAKFGQLTPASLDGFIAWAQHASQRIRAQTSVASTYFSLDLKSHMSAELLKTDEAPMVRRVRSMGEEGSIGQSWRRVNRLIMQIDLPQSKAVVLPRWADPQTRIETQDADTFSKLSPSLGAVHTAQHVLGWSPEQARDGAQEAEEAAARAVDPTLAALSKPLTADAAALNR